MTTPLFVPSRVCEKFTLPSERKNRVSEIESGGEVVCSCELDLQVSGTACTMPYFLGDWQI